MATQPRPLRAEDVPHIPLADPASKGYELVNGELVSVTPANRPHAWLTGEVGRRLGNHVSAADAGRVFVDVWCRLRVSYDPERLRAPDVAFFSNEKLAANPSGDVFHVPPDLAVEIHSTTNDRNRKDFDQRIRDYLDAGVQLLWVIHPEARFAVAYRSDGSAQMLRETDTLDGEDVLPGFRLDLGPLFEQPT